jgi:hypothetical protein
LCGPRGSRLWPSRSSPRGAAPRWPPGPHAGPRSLVVGRVVPDDLQRHGLLREDARHRADVGLPAEAGADHVGYLVEVEGQVLGLEVPSRRRPTAGGSLRFLAVSEAKRLSIPSASKPPSLLYSVLSAKDRPPRPSRPRRRRRAPTGGSPRSVSARATRRAAPIDPSRGSVGRAPACSSSS